MKMMDMKRKAEGHDYDMPSACEVGSEAKYPYGLKLNLGNQEIEKLGIDVSGMSVGDEVAIIAKATITDVSEREELMEGKPIIYRECSLQIKEMALKPEMKEYGDIKSVLKKAMEGM